MKKRAISILLCVVSLLTMLVTVSGAAQESDTLNACGPVGFKDPERITYTEAVSVTGGLGLFAGTTDGRFDPLGTVTRAQMATIIVKMVKGSDFNADSYKGAANPFPDTADYQGGWAEGYINACAQMGIVKGYGDGTFQPGNSVTAAEALTMVLNALKVDAGAGEWPTTVMNKATELKFADGLGFAPTSDKVLNREQLAVIVNAGVQYKPEGGEALLTSVFGVKNINTEHKYGETHCEVCRAAKPGLVTRADLENAVVEVAWDYFMKGAKLQYCSQELDKLGKFHSGHLRLSNDEAPEFGTSDNSIYAVCSDYCYKVYYEAIGHRLLGATSSLNCITYDMWRRTENQPEGTYKSGVMEPISEDDVDYTLMRWKDSSNAAFDGVAKVREVDKSPYFANFGDYKLTFANGYYPTTPEEQAAQTAAAKEFLMDWEKNLRPGDVFCSSGHALLYVGNGYILDVTSTTSVGTRGKYDLENGVEKFEPDGACWRLSTMEWLTGWIFNEKNRDWFVVFRPTKGLVTDDGDGILANDLVIDGAASVLEDTKSRMEFPAMEIDRTASVMPYNTVVSGDELTYSVKITNCTNNEKYITYMTRGGAHYQSMDYKGVTVTETVPAGTQFVSATGDVKNDNGKLTWTVDVPAGQTVEVTYTVKVTAPMGDTITNGGGFVASIPSNTLTHNVGGKKLGQQEKAALTAIADTEVAQWREKFNISALAADLEFAERIYAKMDIDLELPTLTELVTNVFNWSAQPNKASHLNYSDRADMDLFTVNNAPAADYQKYRDMLVENYWGGYLSYDVNGTNINELRAEYLEPGDILVYVTFSVNGEPLTADILVYAGLNSAGEPAVLELNGTTQQLVLHTGQAARDRIWNAFMPKISLFFVLRPSQVLEDVNASSFDVSKEPVYGEEPVVTRPTELGTTTLPEPSIKVLQALNYKDLAAAMKIKFVYNVYDKIGINGMEGIMKSSSGSAITSCTAALATAFTRDGGEEPNRRYKERYEFDTTAGKMAVPGFYAGTWLPDTGKIPTLDDLRPGDALILGSRGLNNKNTPTADELCAVYQGNGKFLLGGYEGYARTGAYGPVTTGYIYGELDFRGEKPVGEFNFGGSSTAMGKVFRTVNDLTQTDEKYGYVKIDSLEHFFTHDPVTGGEWGYAYVLRPSQGVYDIRDLEYAPEAPAN